MRIIVAGMAATYPLGGVFWDYLQYVLGFHELGHEVLYVEDTGQWCYDTVRQTMVESGEISACWLASQIARHVPELNDKWFLRDATGSTFGVSMSKVSSFARDADLFLNVSASAMLRDEYLFSARTLLIDSDPMYTQASMRGTSGDNADNSAHWRLEPLRRHDAFFTFGENVGQPGCLIPTGGLKWISTRQPVVLDRLNAFRVPPESRRRTTTTVASWDRYSKPIVVEGIKYYGKSREFRKYFDLPRRTSVPNEVALAGKPPRDAMLARGWHLADSGRVSQTADDYMHYLADSFAEWSVAKHAYVASNSGWFSGRSACYLAMSVPVIVQDTGFSKFIPTGEGLFAFSTMEEAVAAIEAVESNYERHCKAAREIAEEYFDSRRILSKLIQDAFS